MFFCSTDVFTLFFWKQFLTMITKKEFLTNFTNFKCFPCGQCPKSFSASNDLQKKQHWRETNFTNFTNFKCLHGYQCPKSFSSSKDLSIKVSHQSVTFCGFSSQHLVKMHLSNNHNENIYSYHNGTLYLFKVKTKH